MRLVEAHGQDQGLCCWRYRGRDASCLEVVNFYLISLSLDAHKRHITRPVSECMLLFLSSVYVPPSLVLAVSVLMKTTRIVHPHHASMVYSVPETLMFSCLYAQNGVACCCESVVHLPVFNLGLVV